MTDFRKGLPNDARAEDPRDTDSPSAPLPRQRTWFDRQLDIAAARTATWPDWARREAGLPVDVPACVPRDPDMDAQIKAQLDALTAATEAFSVAVRKGARPPNPRRKEK